MTTSAIRDLPGITNPITHAGRVVYNAKRDFLETRKRKHKRGCAAVYEDGFGPPECHTIQQYELCMRNKESQYLVWSPNDTDVTVFSCANGITLPSSEAKRGDKNANVAAKRRKLDFAGIASNRAIYDPNNSANEEALAVQVGGLQTIYNTGDEDIFAGDIVLWDMPTLDSRGEPTQRYPGIPRKKKLFSTKRYQPGTAVDAVTDLIKKAINDAGGSVDERAATAAQQVQEAMWGYQRRVMGKALSSAAKGEPFDILLGHYLI